MLVLTPGFRGLCDTVLSFTCAHESRCSSVRVDSEHTTKLSVRSNRRLNSRNQQKNNRLKTSRIRKLWRVRVDGAPASYLSDLVANCVTNQIADRSKTEFAHD